MDNINLMNGAMNKEKRQRTEEGQFIPIRYEYKDGRLLTAREIYELHPHIGLQALRQRLPLHNGDWEYTLRPKNTARSRAKLTFDGVTLGPRKELDDVQGPSEYEQQLWGY